MPRWEAKNFGYKCALLVGGMDFRGALGRILIIMLVSVPQRDMGADHLADRLVGVFKQALRRSQGQCEGVILSVDGPTIDECGGDQVLEVLDEMSRIIVGIDDLLDQVKGIILGSCEV